MEINVKEIVSRLDLQHIRNFAFQQCPDSVELKDGTYDERLKEGTKLMLNRLQSICGGEQELADATDDFFHSLAIYSEVYSEIGIKVGARLLFQLLFKDD